MRQPKVLRHAGFWKRAILLGCVVTFVTYITVAYEVDLQNQSSLQASLDASSIPQSTIDRAKGLILMILPIDLLGIGLSAGLFAVLSLEDLPDLLKQFEHRVALFTQIGLLFLVTGLWHFLMVAWWVIFTLHTGDVTTWITSWALSQDHNLYDVVYHSLFGMAHLCYFYLWRQLELGERLEARKSLLEWWGVAVYATLVVSVYVTRLSAYVEKYVDPERFVDRLSARPLLLPLLVFASALVSRLTFRWLGDS